MKISSILYNDPKSGMPVSYPHNALPNREEYTDGMNLLSPKEIDFRPRHLQGYISRELGLTKSQEGSVHKSKVISDNYREGSEAEKGLIDDASVIPQPFFPFNLSREPMESALTFKRVVIKNTGSNRVDSESKNYKIMEGGSPC
ncbi:MAG: hypothetical protein P8P90_04990 [Opitutales bacterium]|nr:hypothetical protein [Opitutales bacterium]